MIIIPGVTGKIKRRSIEKIMQRKEGPFLFFFLFITLNLTEFFQNVKMGTCHCGKLQVSVTDSSQTEYEALSSLDS